MRRAVQRVVHAADEAPAKSRNRKETDMTDNMTRSARVNADLTNLLRSRHTLLWLTTREEQRVERAVMGAAADAKMVTAFWDCATGVTINRDERRADLRDPQQALAWLREQDGRIVLVMRDLHRWLDPITTRSLRSSQREFASLPPNVARAIVLLTPPTEVPPELAACATVVDYPLPERAEVAALLDEVVAALPDGLREAAAPNGTRDAAIDAALGLTAEEAANCYAQSLVKARKIDPREVAASKRRVVERERVLTWYEPDPRGLDAVGGLDVLKGWLRQRRAAFSPAARRYGLPAPRGCFLVGVPGCGKSLTAKAIASAWAMPLLRLDMGALRSKFVGDSEQNIRRALQTAEAVAPCVLWLDEIEKSLAGATGAQGDGGVAADALGAVLSWMQERSGSVFVVATANDVRALPPELLRKGRFDELWFVDLPTTTERVAILAAALRGVGRVPEAFDLQRVAQATAGWTGAELAALLPDAMFAAFAAEREVATDDLLAAAAATTPLSSTAKEKLAQLREWAQGRARCASLPENTKGAATSARALDL
jgi:hypothetical protein